MAEKRQAGATIIDFATRKRLDPEMCKPGRPSGVMHLVTQDDQPYGSVRRCCELCGRAVFAMDAAVEGVSDRRSLRKQTRVLGYAWCDTNEAKELLQAKR